MDIANLDWIIIISFSLLTLLIGFIVSKKSGENASEFFLSSRNMPWWLLGLSMVATTFSTDTPNLVTDIVRNNGVAGILAMLLALAMIYSLLFATGYFIYGNLQLGGIFMFIALISAYLLSKVWSRIKVDIL